MDLEQLRSLREAAPAFVRRQGKTLRQVEYGWDHHKQLGFVFGCQWSGSAALLRVLDESPATRIVSESHAAAFTDFRLRSDTVVRALVRTHPAPVQIFEPLCESQRADGLLARFPTARALWVYRPFDEVATLAARTWGAHQRAVVGALVSGDAARWGWRTERVPPGVIEAIRAVHRPDLRDVEGALLFWYLRNAFFFELGLDRDPRVRLVRHEDVAARSEPGLAAAFAHVRAPFEPARLGRGGPAADRQGDPAPVRPAIRALCADLLARLDAWAPAPAAQPPLVSPVLLLIDNLTTGGAERYVVTAANWVAERGGDVAIAAAPGELTDDLSPRVTFVPAPISRVRVRVPLAALSLRTILRDRQPAVIVSNSLAVTWIARAAQGRRRIPIIAVAHGWPERRYRFVGPLFRVADKVVAVSPEVKEKLVRSGLDADRCKVILNGVDCTPFGRREGEVRANARVALGAGPDDIVVINVGRLSAQKAHQHVIAVASRLRERHPRLRYAIVGAGERIEELRTLVHAAGVADIVRLLGLRADIADLLGAADLFLSCSNWEGMPLSTIEAMASELPTVATRTEGAAHLLTPECGVIVPVGEIGAMADAVDRLAGDVELRARMGAEARRRALDAFSHHRMVGELMALAATVAGP